MATFDMLNNVGSTIINIGLPLILLLFLAVIGIAVYKSGILTRYPYTCLLRSPRSGGYYKISSVKGRSVKGGKMELKFGMWDKVTVSEPKEEYVQEGNFLEGIMNSKEEVTWIKTVEVNEAELKLKAAVPENAQLAYAVAFGSAYERTHKQKAWMQFAPYVALIIAAVILFGGMYVQGNMNKDGMNAYAAAIDRHSNLLENSSIVIYKQGTTTGGTSGFPNTPSNLPPG
jgi:hypothetical protein